jgi:hypothetical protein
MSGKDQYKPLSDDELIVQMLELRDQDPEGFAELVISTLIRFRQEAIDDEAPVEKKLKALGKLKDYFEEREEFEKCAFARDLINDIIQEHET